MSSFVQWWSSADRKTSQKVFVIAIVVEYIVVTGLTIQDLVDESPMTSTNRLHYLFALLFLFMTIAVAYLGINSTMRENVVELVLYLLSLLLVLAYVVYNFVYPTHVFQGDRVALWIRLAIVSLFVAFSLPAAVIVKNTFGYFAMEMVGLDAGLQSAFQSYSVFVAFFKLDCLLGTCCVYVAGMTLLKPDEVLLAACALAVTFCGTFSGLYVAKTGKRQGLWALFFVVAPLEPAYIVYKLIMFFLHESRYRSRVQYVGALFALGVCALLVRIVLVVYAIRVRANGPLAAITLGEKSALLESKRKGQARGINDADIIYA
eukprot:Amastigsp_a844635_15.p1 type:complete len:318 gc:universal Amastigsp_a844635_15:83-1036(+)